MSLSRNAYACRQSHWTRIPARKLVSKCQLRESPVNTCQRAYVESPALSVQDVDHVSRADRLAVADLDDTSDILKDVFEVALQLQAGLLVDVLADALDAAAARQAADVGPSYAIDVVPEDFAGDGALAFLEP